MPMPKGEIDVQILDDGRLRIETGDMGGVAHKAADDFLKFCEQMMGGAVERAKAEHAHQHHHAQSDATHRHHQ
jgi:hypothetical protein